MNEKMAKNTFVKKQIYERFKKRVTIAILLTLIITLPTIFYAGYQAALANPGSTPVFEHPAGSYSYLIWEDNSIYYAKNGDTGAVFSGTDITTVVRSARDATTSGTILVKAGVPDFTINQKAGVLIIKEQFAGISPLELFSGPWRRYANNPILVNNSAIAWESDTVQGPSVVYNDYNNEYLMLYSGWDSVPKSRVGLAYSSDGLSWTKYVGNPVIDLGAAGTWDDDQTSIGKIIDDGGTFKVWYHGNDGAMWRIGLATSTDAGRTWTKYAGNPVLTYSETWESGAGVADTAVIKDESAPASARYKMWYVGYGGAHPYHGQIGYATSPDGITWTKYAGNPVVAYGSAGEWDDGASELLDVAKIGDVYIMIYEGAREKEPSAETPFGATIDRLFNLGLAYSYDGITWTKDLTSPILWRAPRGRWDDQHTLHPSIVVETNRILLYYAGVDGATWSKIGKIGVAKRDFADRTQVLNKPMLIISNPITGASTTSLTYASIPDSWFSFDSRYLPKGRIVAILKAKLTGAAGNTTTIGLYDPDAGGIVPNSEVTASAGASANDFESGFFELPYQDTTNVGWGFHVNMKVSGGTGTFHSGTLIIFEVQYEFG